MILLNGHGGNVAPTQAISVKLAQEDVWALHISYFHMVDDELKEWGDSDDSIGHGGEWETSLQLHLRGHLIDLDKRAPNGLAPWFRDPVVGKFAKWPERRRESRRGRDGRSLCGQCRKRRAHFQPWPLNALSWPVMNCTTIRCAATSTTAATLPWARSRLTPRRRARQTVTGKRALGLDPRRPLAKLQFRNESWVTNT